MEIGIMTLQVGRKPKSKNLGLMQSVQLPLCRIDWQPFFVRGSKREIRDEDGKLVYSARNMRMGAKFCMQKDVQKMLECLKQNGYKKPKAHPMSQWLPRICPDCGNEGTITWNYERRDQIKEDGVLIFTTDYPRIRFWFNHSRTKPKRCFLGTWDYGQSQIRLKEGTDIRKMLVSYYLKEGEIKEFNIN